MIYRRSWVLAGILLAGLGYGLGGAAEATADTLEKIRDSGRIVLGYRDASYPFSFREDNRPSGYSVELCAHVVEAVRDTLALESLDVDYVLVTPETRIPSLRDGEIDVECGSTTNTLTRQEQVDFTHLIFVTGAKLLVRANTGIHGFGDLAGKSLAMTGGTTTEAGVKTVLERTGIAVETLIVSDHDAGFAALAEGRVEAYISDHILLHGLRQRAEQPEDFVVVGDFLSYEPYALMVRRNDADFRLVANRALSELFRSNRIDEIYRYWFEPMGVAPGDLLKAAVRLQALPR